VNAADEPPVNGVRPIVAAAPACTGSRDGGLTTAAGGGSCTARDVAAADDDADAADAAADDAADASSCSVAMSTCSGRADRPALAAKYSTTSDRQANV